MPPLIINDNDNREGDATTLVIRILGEARTMALGMTRSPERCRQLSSSFLILFRAILAILCGTPQVRRNVSNALPRTLETYITRRCTSLPTVFAVSFLAMHRRVAPARSKKCFVRHRGWRRSGAFLHYQPIKPLSLTMDRFLAGKRSAGSRESRLSPCRILKKKCFA